MAEDPNKFEGLKEVPASEILAKIEKGQEIHYNHVIIKGDLDISSLNLPEGKDGRKVLEAPLSLHNCQIHGKIILSEVIVKFGINVRNTQIRDDVYISSEFSEKFGFDFERSIFYGHAFFDGSKFRGYVCFRDCEFINISSFINSEFMMYTDFSGTKFKFLARFEGSQFSGEMLTFRGAEFEDKKSQENACRKAKQLMEKTGDREEAGYYFYREMDAKRKQKPWYIRYPEFVFIQLIFGYGVHPPRLMFCWFLMAVIFALLYSLSGGIISKLPASSLPQPWSYFVECFYFSIVTAVTPGYGKYELTSWVYQVVASFEAIFGTFMWAAFIATFARKYMR